MKKILLCSVFGLMLQGVMPLEGSVGSAAAATASAVQKMPVLTATQIAMNGNPANWKTPFQALNSAQAEIIYPPFSCANGLTELSITLTSGTTSADSIFFYFDKNSLSTLKPVMAAGMYILVNLLTYNSVNYVQVQLTDMNNKVYAHGIYPLPGGAPQYASIGFNTSQTFGVLPQIDPSKGQTFINWINLSPGCRVLYQQMSGVTTKGQGSIGLTPSSLSSLPLILATSKIRYSTKQCNFGGTFPTPALPATYSLVSSTPFSCQGGISSFNVAVTDATETCLLNFNFDQSIMSDPRIQKLASVGMYINVRLKVRTKAHQDAVTVQILDVNQKLYAYGTYASSTLGAVDHWDIVFNTNNIGNINGTTQLGYNDVALTQTVLYQQLATVSQPAGAAWIPNFATAYKINPSITIPAPVTSNDNLTLLALSPVFASGMYAELYLNESFPAFFAAINTANISSHRVLLYCNLLPSLSGQGYDQCFVAYDVTTQANLASGRFSSIQSYPANRLIQTTDTFKGFNVSYQYSSMSKFASLPTTTNNPCVVQFTSI